MTDDGTWATKIVVLTPLIVLLIWLVRDARRTMGRRKQHAEALVAFELVMANCRDEWPGAVTESDCLWATPTCFVWRINFRAADYDNQVMRSYVHRELAAIIHDPTVTVIGMGGCVAP